MGRQTGDVDESIGRSLGGLCDRLLNDVLFTQRPAGGHEPLFPFRWGLGFIIGAEQLVPADGAAIPLGCKQLEGVLVQRWGPAFAPALSPVVGQGRVID